MRSKIKAAKTFLKFSFWFLANDELHPFVRGLGRAIPPRKTMPTCCVSWFSLAGQIDGQR